MKLVPHDDIEQVLCVELLPACVLSDASSDQTVRFEVVEVELSWWVLVSLCRGSGEEDLNVVDKLHH